MKKDSQIFYVGDTGYRVDIDRENACVCVPRSMPGCLIDAVESDFGIKVLFLDPKPSTGFGYVAYDYLEAENV